MKKVYYENQYLTQIETDITKITKQDGKYLVELKDNIFFPGGGGQNRDFGTIDGIKIEDIIEKDDTEIYLLSRKPDSIHNVQCILDWQNRVDYMQQHLAQHVLSGCFFTLFNANTAGIHLGKDISYVDIVGHIDIEKIRFAEIKANDVIHDDRKVTFTICDRQKAINMGLRRKLQTDDDKIRVVKIEGHDVNACCGVHPSRTIELQMIKIINHEKHKENTRIFFMSGKRAIDYALINLNKLSDICLKLSTGPQDIYGTIDNLKNDNDILKEKNIKTQSKLSEYEITNLLSKAEKINDYKLIVNIFQNYDQKYLSKMMSKVTEQENNIILFCNIMNDKVSLIYGCSKNIQGINMGNLLKQSLKVVNGKGGGSKFLAQGVFEKQHLSHINAVLDVAKCNIFSS